MFVKFSILAKRPEKENHHNPETLKLAFKLRLGEKENKNEEKKDFAKTNNRHI